MPRYEIQAPDGRTFELEGDRMPTASELQSIFARMSGGGERRTHRPEDYMDPQPEPEGSAFGRFASNAWEMVNPVSIAKGVYQTVRHPLETGKAIVGSQIDQLGKGAEAFREGRYSEAAGHTAAGLLPVVGPMAANIGEQIGSGDIAGGLGKAAGVAAPYGVGKALTSGAKRAAAQAAPERVAAALERGASERVADVLSPRANTNVGRRMGNKAQKIAPALAKDAEITGQWSKQGMKQAIAAKLDHAVSALDDANDARLSAVTFETKPIIDALKDARSKLTSKAVDAEGVSYQRITVGGKPATTWVKRHGQLGKDVVPAPLKPRVNVIDQAIKELETLGPVARYDDLRLIRQAYDAPAKTVYNPSMTADFLAKKGESLGAADVTGVLREHLAKMDPVTAEVNSQYSLYRNAHDILQAAEEIERVRPKVGRQIMARLTATLFGGQQAGVAGAAAGYVLGPTLDSLVNAGYTTKLQTAKLMQQMADAIRRGDVGRVASVESRLKTLAKRSAVSTAQATQQPQLAGNTP